MSAPPRKGARHDDRHQERHDDRHDERPDTRHGPTHGCWVLAFTEGPASDDLIWHMHDIVVMRSDDASGLYWSRPPFRFSDKHSPFLPPALTCTDPQNYDRCLLIYNSYDESDGQPSRLRQQGIEFDTAYASGLDWIDGSWLSLGRHNWGRVSLAGTFPSGPGWVFTRLDEPGKYRDNLTWTWRAASQGISGTWNGGATQTSVESELGFSVACANIGSSPTPWWCRFVWIRGD